MNHTPTTVYLIRHGQSQANVGGITLANPIVPLTELGQLQAQALAQLLTPSSVKIWASPFRRALDTAAPYCARMGRSAATHDDLREFETVDTAQMSGSSSAEREAVVARYWIKSDPEQRTGPAAETFREFHDRIARVRTQFLPALPDGTMIFGHGMWMALLFWQIWGFAKIDHIGMSLFRRFQLGFPTPNTSVYRLTHAAAGSWDVRVDEAAMRAIAAIGAGLDQRSKQQERVDVHDDAEHNVEIEASVPPRTS
jgi:broad specificity phosphatase PhoE